MKLPVLGERAEGKYIVRVRAAAYPYARERFRYLEFTSGYGTGRRLLGWRKVTAPLGDPQIIEFTLEHSAGEKQQIWVHQRSHQDRGDKNLATIDMRKNGFGTPPGMWIDWAELIGPLPESHDEQAVEKILFAKPNGWSTDRYAKEVIRRFAVSAFRGAEPDADFLERLFLHYSARRAKGRSRSKRCSSHFRSSWLRRAFFTWSSRPATKALLN